MPGNSRRRGAIRKTTKGNPTAGSGGRVRQKLEGKGPTPKAKDREGHVARRRSQVASSSKGRDGRSRSGSRSRGGSHGSAGSSEWVAGRNAVVEALHADVPVTTMYVAAQTERDDRLKEALRIASARGLTVLQVPRSQIDQATGETAHQGVALKVPPYAYAHPDDLVSLATEDGQSPLLVALDSITDPRNLGAIVRSAAAFGVHGVVVPERRAAGMTASAWKTSAGSASRVPVARATNLTRQLKAYQSGGLSVVGLDAAADTGIEDLETAVATAPLVLVIGSEGKGLSRLVRDTCDALVRIPMRSGTESLNAAVAAGVALYEIARRRSQQP